MTVANSAIPLAQHVIPTVIAKTGWSPTAITSLGTLITALLTLTGIIAVNGPKWFAEYRAGRAQNVELQNKADAASASAKEAARLLEEERVARVELRIKALEDRAQQAEQVVMHLTGATTLLLSALRVAAPDNPAIGQAHDLIEMAVAAGNDSYFSKSLSRLVHVKGTGE